jgi:hypothetical protein
MHLQISILAAALVFGLIPEQFNGLSVLAILLASPAFLLQPGVTLRSPPEAPARQVTSSTDGGATGATLFSCQDPSA